MTTKPKDTPKDTPQDATTDLEMLPGQHNPFANALLHNAQRLSEQKDSLMAQIDANRKGLRSLRTQDLMSAAQAAAVEEFYPTRERKTKTDGDGTPAAASS